MSDFVFEGADYRIYATRSLPDMPTLTDKWLGLDTEFTGGGLRVEGAKLRLLQVANESEALVLDMEENGHAEYSKKVLAGRKLFAHNSRAEVGSCFLGLGIDISPFVYDTLTIARLCYPDNRTHKVGLKELAPKFLGRLGVDLLEAEDELHDVFRQMYIDAKMGTKAASAEKVMAYGFTHIDRRHPAYLRYAGLDALAVRRLGPKLYKVAETLGVKGVIQDELEDVAIANRMTNRGWRIDGAQLDKVDNGARVVHAEVQQEFLELTGYKPSSVLKYNNYFKPNFPKVQYTNWNKPNKDGVRTPKLGGEEVAELAEKYPEIEAFEILARFKQTENLVKFTGTVEKFLDPDLFIHADINTLGAKTGRWTVKNPGIQTASSSSGARDLFIPSQPDHVLVSADLGQIEPRVAYTLAGCTDLVEQMRSGIDAYTAAAITMFGPDFTPFERKLTKRVVLGALYAAGIDTLVFQAKYTDGWKGANREAISQARNDFNNSIPEINGSGRGGQPLGLARKLQRDDIVRLPSGRFVPFDEDRMVEGRRKSYRYKGINYLCQGAARDELMLRMRLVSAAGLDQYLLMAMHDELLFSIPVAMLKDAVTTIRDIMEMGFQGTPTPTDIEIYRNNWGEKPYTATPAGLLLPTQREGEELSWSSVKAW